MVRILSGSNTCDYRETPWDQAAFGIKTRELLAFDASNVENLAALAQAVDDANRRDGVGLCYTRISQNQKRLISTLISQGFEQVECSYTLHLNNFSAFFPNNSFGRNLELRDASDDDLAALQSIAADDFHYGRFIEDPKISSALARQRQRNWMNDMFYDKSVTIWVSGPPAKPRAFHCFRTKENHADMILTGAAKAYGALAGFLWTSCLHHTAKLGILSVSTLISASNLPVLNLYARLGFQFDQLFVGLHKHYSSSKGEM